MEAETTERPVKRRGRPSKTKSIELHRKIIECNSSSQLPTQQSVAEQVGVDRATVSRVLAKYGINKQELDQFVDNRVDIVRSKQQMILDNITPDKIQRSTFKDLAIGYGILLDKDRLESGQSTTNVASLHSIAERAIRSVSVASNPPAEESSAIIQQA